MINLEMADARSAIPRSRWEVDVFVTAKVTGTSVDESSKADHIVAT